MSLHFRPSNKGTLSLCYVLLRLPTSLPQSLKLIPPIECTSIPVGIVACTEMVLVKVRGWLHHIFYIPYAPHCSCGYSSLTSPPMSNEVRPRLWVCFVNSTHQCVWAMQQAARCVWVVLWGENTPQDPYSSRCTLALMSLTFLVVVLTQRHRSDLRSNLSIQMLAFRGLDRRHPVEKDLRLRSRLATSPPPRWMSYSVQVRRNIINPFPVSFTSSPPVLRSAHPRCHPPITSALPQVWLHILP